MGKAAVELQTEKQAADIQKSRLLVVDENPEDLSYYSNILERLRYQVRRALSFDEGVGCLDQDKFDLVIVSQGTPGFEGRTVLAHAHEKDRKTPVLVLARHHDMSAYIDAMQLGAFDYVEKPVDPSEIAELVEKHVPSGHA